MAHKVPDYIANGEPTREQLGRYLEGGFEIRSQPASQAYRDGWEAIFGKKEEVCTCVGCGPHCPKCRDEDCPVHEDSP